MGSVIATIAIGATASAALLTKLAPGLEGKAAHLATMAYPLMVIMVGLVASLVGVAAGSPLGILWLIAPGETRAGAVYIP